MKALSKNELRKRAFRKFLYDNDALEEWYRNTIAHNGSMRKYDRDEPYNSPIMNAFGWSETPEGHDFWSKLNNKWKEMSKSRVD